MCGSGPASKTWPLLPAQLHARRQEHHPVRSSAVCSRGAQAARRLQEIQSSHPAMGHAGPRAMQTRNARSALGGPAIGANSAVLSLHPAGETAESSPPSVFSHLDWLSRIFYSFLQQRIARVRSKVVGDLILSISNVDALPSKKARISRPTTTSWHRQRGTKRSQHHAT